MDSNKTPQDLKDYLARGKRIFNQVPAFNVVQVRWFENLREAYKSDVFEMAKMIAKQPENSQLAALMQQAVNNHEIMEFIVNQMTPKK